MSQIIHHDRNGCSLHGAVKALCAVEGLVPILHASAGCGLGARFPENTLAGSLAGTAGWQETSGTNLLEKHVVFGGTSRLREQIKNTVKVLKGDLYVVATGCVPEVVGDDVPAMVKEAREQRFPVIGISTPGFKGNGWHGAATAVRQVLEQLPTLEDLPVAKDVGLVNLLGIAPGLDPFWEGDLLELEAALAPLGLRANRLHGIGQKPSNWKEARNAALDIVLSPWGLEAARFLEQRDGIPFLDFGFVPVASRDVGLLLAEVSQRLGLPAEPAAELALAEDRKLRYHLRKAAPTWLSGEFQRRTAVVAGSSAAVGLSRYLSGTLGQIVTTVAITDNPPEDSRTALVQRIRDASEGIEIDVSFAESSVDVLRALSAARPELVLASSLERLWTVESGAALVEVSAPLREELVLDQSLAGTRGALSVTTRISRALLSAGRAQASGIRPEGTRGPGHRRPALALPTPKGCESCG